MRTELLELLNAVERHQRRNASIFELSGRAGGRTVRCELDLNLYEIARAIRAKLDLQEKGEREAADELVEHELPTAAEKLGRQIRDALEQQSDG